MSSAVGSSGQGTTVGLRLDDAQLAQAVWNYVHGGQAGGEPKSSQNGPSCPAGWAKPRGISRPVELCSGCQFN